MLGAKLEGLVLAKQECMTSTWEGKKRARQSSYPCPAPRRKNERVFNLEGSRGLVADTGWSRKDPCMRTVLTRSSIYVADLCSQIQAHSLPRSPTCPKDCHWALSQDDCCSTKAGILVRIYESWGEVRRPQWHEQWLHRCLCHCLESKNSSFPWLHHKAWWVVSITTWSPENNIRVDPLGKQPKVR